MTTDLQISDVEYDEVVKYYRDALQRHGNQFKQMETADGYQWIGQVGGANETHYSVEIRSTSFVNVRLQATYTTK